MTQRRGVVHGTLHAWEEGGLRLLAVRAIRRAKETVGQVTDRTAAAGAARALRTNQPANLADAFDFVGNFVYAGVAIRPMQVTSELRTFLDWVATDPPRTVLEIGTGRGGTLFLLTRAAHERALLISIDAPESQASFGGRSAYKRRARLYRAFAKEGQRVVYLASDSHRPQTRDRIVELLAGRPLDLLFIDGDHAAEGVEADFRMYSSLVRRGGLVAFHDIVPGSADLVGGVPAFWQRTKDERALEFVEDWSQGGCGIGVLRL